MGRYAFFSTGFEYKFAFGVQPSEDILLFGGNACFEDSDYGYLKHSWEKEDMSLIEKKLQECLEWLGIDPVKFESYEKNNTGTYNLVYDLQHLTKEHNEEVTARYILGCAIYHQLLYTDALVADYEG